MKRDMQELTDRDKAMINRRIKMTAAWLCKKTAASAAMRRKLKEEYIRCGHFAVCFHLHRNGWSERSENALFILSEKAKFAMTRHVPFSSDATNIALRPRLSMEGKRLAANTKIPDSSFIPL